jgi:antibiotic biosynthesis monooxygenase (ABM) superfamily enzyme
MSVLGCEWSRTTAALASWPDPAARQVVVRRRQEVFDELERRDPAGFARWLAAGAAEDRDPATFVRGGRATGTDAA